MSDENRDVFIYAVIGGVLVGAVVLAITIVEGVKNNEPGFTGITESLKNIEHLLSNLPVE